VTIERLVVELDFPSAEAYHNFANGPYDGFYQQLQRWLEEYFFSMSYEGSKSVLIEKLELDLGHLEKHKTGTHLIFTDLKKAAVSPSDFKTVNDQTIGNRQPLEITKPLVPLPINARKQLIYASSEEKSFQQYLRTGDFITGLVWTAEQIKKYLENTEELKKQLARIDKYQRPKQQLQALRRLLPFVTPEALIQLLDSSAAGVSSQVLRRLLPFVTPEALIQLLDSSAPGVSSQVLRRLLPFVTPEALTQLLDSSAPGVSSQALGPIAEMLKKQSQKSDEPKDTVQAAETKPVSKLPTITGLHTEYAGIVLIVPFLQGYFAKMDMLTKDNKEFINPSTRSEALQCLAYLVQGKEAETEHGMGLLKLLCGLRPDEAVDISVKVNEKNKAISNKLLAIVSKRWEIKLGDEIDVLRHNFLQREGRLQWDDDRWELTVETKSFDQFLLPKLPWAFQLVKLKWMDHFIHTNWA